MEKTNAEHTVASPESSVKPKQPVAKRLSITVADFFRRPSRSPRSFNTSGQRSRPKSWTWHALSHIFSFLWLGPVIALLVLNFKHFIIGPSIWCPYGNCKSNVLGQDAIAAAVKLDKNDHNMLGILQFLAKALEVWFGIIAALLVYDVVMIIARMQGGMPLGYMLLHLEFHDLRNIFYPSYWMSPFPRADTSPSQTAQKSIWKLVLVAVLVGYVTIVTNLMDPALAVLMLPVLQWINTGAVPQEMFHDMSLSTSPDGDHTLKDCDGTQLHAGNFSCTYSFYGSSVDALASWTNSTLTQVAEMGASPITASMQESSLAFTLNTTANDSTLWVPNRQVLDSMSQDFAILQDPSKSKVGITQLNDSIQVLYNRQGPTVGLQPNFGFGNLSVTPVGEDRVIQCYSNWSTGTGQYTKCYRVGEGFSENNEQANFSIGNGPNPGDSSPVQVFFSDLATYFNESTDFGSGIRPCLDPKAAPGCDWDQIFDQSELPSFLSNASSNVLVTSYSLPNGTTGTPSPGVPAPGPQARMYAEANTFLGMATYTLDTSPNTNPLDLVRLDAYQKAPTHEPLVINPDWILAGWSVDRGGTVKYTRPIAQQMSVALPSAWGRQPDTVEWTRFLLLQIYTSGQAMSMVDYVASSAMGPVDEDDPVSVVLDAIGDPLLTGTSDQSLHQVLYVWATRRVWAWDIHGSKTTELGAGIAIAGGICVLIRLVLGLFAPRKKVDTIELLAAALEYRSGGKKQGAGGAEFAGLHGQERQMAKIRYQLRDEQDEEEEDDEEGVAVHRHFERINGTQQQQQQQGEQTGVPTNGNLHPNGADAGARRPSKLVARVSGVHKRRTRIVRVNM